MSDGNASHTWEENCARPLRRPGLVRPNNPTNGNITNGQESENRNGQRNSTDLDILQNSSLSPRAPEWYPANYRAETTQTRKRAPRQAAQDRLLFYKQTLSPAPDPGSKDEPEENADTERQAIGILEDLMQNLIRNPARFEDILGSFIETLTPFYMDFQFIEYITELIVEKVLSDPNFRYSAVRLCVVIQLECGIFRSALCLLCQKKAERSNDFNLTLLLAELYTQLGYDNIYANLLINSLKGILDSNPDENSVKAACQVLKLTGFALENDHRKEISVIFTKLLVARDHQLLSIKNLIDSVTSLREQNWGRTTSNINTTHNSNHTTDTRDGPVFYGPDGQELTEEEQQFLHDNCSSRESTHSDAFIDGIDEDWWDPEMTDEIREAFEQFIINEN